MAHEHLQPFFSEPLDNYQIFRARQVAEGLVITLARSAPPSKRGLAWRIVVVPNGVTYHDRQHVGCAVFFPIGHDGNGYPDESSRWLHKALCAPAQRRYRILVRDVWQCFSRHGLCVVDAMATLSGIVAITYGDDPTLLTLREVAPNGMSDAATPTDRIISGECSVQYKPHANLKASNFKVGDDMYEHVISSIKSSPNDLMHLPTFKLDYCALEHSMAGGETSQVIELLQQSTAINKLDVSNRRSYRSALEMAALWDRDRQVFQLLLEKGGQIWIDANPHVGTMMEIVRRKNLDALHLLLSADQPHDLVRWWDHFGVLMCKHEEFPEGGDMFRTHLAKKTALHALADQP